MTFPPKACAFRHHKLVGAAALLVSTALVAPAKAQDVTQDLVALAAEQGLIQGTEIIGTLGNDSLSTAPLSETPVVWGVLGD
ncbi:MAG: hypothetical protein AAGF59_08395, partial [Pseudomonadota bacterium]